MGPVAQGLDLLGPAGEDRLPCRVGDSDLDIAEGHVFEYKPGAVGARLVAERCDDDGRADAAERGV